MIALPEKARAWEIADAEEVEAPFSDGTRASPGPAVDVDVATSSSGSGPDIEPLIRTHQRARAHSVGLALALLVSVAVHAAVLAYLGERTARSGLEAASDAVRLEIVFEAPPSRQIAGTDPAAASQEIADAPDMPESAIDPGEAEPLPAEAIDEPPATEVPDTPSEAEAPDSAASSQNIEQPAEAAPAPEEGPPVHSILPQENVPLPTPRPEPPQVRSQPKASAQTQVKSKTAPRKQTAEREKPAARKAEPAHQAAPEPTAGRQGGATAGEEKAYGRRLARHVERHKRYPREAARQGVTGDAGLSITIDRQGRLTGARLSRSSGHPLLDEAALATARRASPYPSLPQGVGGSTYTFTLTLRFSR